MTNNTLHYAMRLGLLLGLFWIVKFCFFPLGLTYPTVMFFFMGLTAAVPFVAYSITKFYKVHACDGSLSFGQAWWFVILLFFFAGLVVAVAHYVYFQFIDQGHVLATYRESLDSIREAGLTDYAARMQDMLEQMKSIRPIEITYSLLWNNVWWGCFLGIFIALFVKGKKKD